MKGIEPSPQRPKRRVRPLHHTLMVNVRVSYLVIICQVWKDSYSNLPTPL